MANNNQVKNTKRVNKTSSSSSLKNVNSRQGQGKLAWLLALGAVVIIVLGVVNSSKILSKFFSSVTKSVTCDATKKTGENVAATLSQNTEVIAVINEGCFTGDPPSSDSQRSSVYLGLDGSYGSGIEATTKVAELLKSHGWVAEQSNSRIILKKSDYKIEIKALSYSPALVMAEVSPIEVNKDFKTVMTSEATLPANITTEFPEDKAKPYFTIPLYDPKYVPQGYSSWSLGKFNSPENLNSRVFYLQGGKGEVKPQLHVYSKVTTSVNRQCLTPEACQEIKTAQIIRNGSSVKMGTYFATTPKGFELFKNDTDIWTVIDDYLVGIYYAQNHIYVDPSISTEEIINLFDSLTPTNTPAKTDFVESRQ